MRFSLLVIVVVLTLRSLSAGADSAWNWNSHSMNASADLNGDGKLEAIQLQKFEGKDKTGKSNQRYFRLTINGQSIYDAAPGRGLIQGFRFADIDKGDSLKEVVVEVAGFESMDWSGYLIYWFDGNTIHRVTRKPLTVGLSFHGDGRVTKQRYLSGPLSAEIPYQLVRDHTLRKIQQSYFKAEAQVRVKKVFPIYSRPSLRRVAMLRAGTKVKILKSDLNDWLYVRAGRSTYGWMNTRWNNPYAAFGWIAAG